MNNFIIASIFMILSSLACIISDICSKFFTSSTINLLFFRFFIATIISFSFYRSKNFLNINNLIRGILLASSMFFFTTGLNNLPLPFVILINFTIPIWNTIFSKIILKEKITNRLITCSINTIAILYISYNFLNTNKSSFLYIISILISSFLFALMDVLNKFSLNRESETPGDIVMGFSFFSTILFMPFISYEIPNLNNIYLISIISITAILIPYFMLKASQFSDLSALQPLKYLEFPISLLANQIFFNQQITNDMYIIFIIIIINTTISYIRELNN